MSYVTSEARQQLLDAVAEAADEVGRALAALGGAYEQLDDASADRLETELFRPVQVAYGRIKRTHAEFADRHALPAHVFSSAEPGRPSQGVKGFLTAATDAVGRAQSLLSTLQDSMMPVDVGDAELRAGLSETRTLVGQTSERARQFTRTLGR